MKAQRAPLFCYAALLALSACKARNAAPETSVKEASAEPTLSKAEVQELLGADVQTVEQFLERGGFDAVTFAFRSGSLFQSEISPRFPRIVLTRGDTVFGLIGNPDAPAEASNSVEVITFKDERFAFHLAALGPSSAAAAQPDCSSCHDGRPIWINYPIWPGFFGAMHDARKFPALNGNSATELPQETALVALCERISQKTADSIRYRLALGNPEDTESCLKAYYDPEPNAAVSGLLETLRFKAMAPDFKRLKNLEALRFLVGAGTTQQITSSSWRRFISSAFRKRHEAKHGAKLRELVGNPAEGDLLEHFQEHTVADLKRTHADNAAALASDNPSLQESMLEFYSKVETERSDFPHLSLEAFLNFGLVTTDYVALLRYLLEPCLPVADWSISRNPGESNYAFMSHPRFAERELSEAVFGESMMIQIRGHHFHEFAEASRDAFDEVDDVCELVEPAAN